MPSFKEYLENRKNSDTVDTAPISGSFQSYLIQRKAQEWNDSVNSIYKKMQGDFNQRSSGMGPLPSVGQYKSAISKDINNLLNNYSYAEEYANQIQDQKERQSYLNSIQKAKSSLDSFSREFQTGNPDVWNGSLTNALNKPSENHQIPEGNESLLSAEQLRAKIAEIESKRDEQLKKQEEKLKNSGLSGWMVNLFLSDEAKRNMADESDDSLKDELTKYKQQLYYAENEEKLNGLSHDLQQRVNAYLEKTAARKKFDELAQDGVVLNDDEYLIRNGKRYTVKELQQMSDSLTDDDARLIVSELNSNGVDGQALLDYLKLKQGQDFIQEERKDAEQYAKDHPIASSIQSVFQTPLKLLGAVDAGMTAASNAITGQEAPIDYSKPVYSAARDQSTIRETVSSEIGNSVGQFLYQTGMSMGDFLTLMPLAAVPGGQAAVTAILGGSAATDTAMDVSSRGGTASQAFWSGLAAGAAEAAFEKFSLEAVLKAGKVTGIKSFIKELLKGAGVEGSEEVATEIANIISDQIIMGDKSNYSLAVKQYMDSGLSKPEAEKQATLDMVKQVGLAFAGGALSGGVIHGVQGGINWAGNYAEGKNTLHNGNIRDAIRLGFESDVDSPAYKTAVELSERLAKGEKISPSEVGAMVSDAQAQLTEKRNKAAVDSVQQVSNNAPDVSQKTNIGTQVQELRRSAAQEVQNQRAALISDNNTVKNGLARPLKAEATVSVGYETRQTTVNGIKRVTENGVEVQLEDGSVVPLEAVSFSNAEMEGLYADAAGYDTTTARAFVAGYDGSLPLSTYESAFDSIHEQAMRGADVDSAVEAAGVYGQMMSENARKLAYNTGRLQAGRQGGTIENNSVEAGGQHRGEKESVDVRQYQGASGGSDGRGRAGDGQRSRVSGLVEESDGRISDLAEKSKRGKPKRKIKLSSQDGDLSFDAIRNEDLTPKQALTVGDSAKYGYDLYYYSKGTVFNDGESDKVIDRPAFMMTGIKAIFALDGLDIDFLHHELFHQFFSENQEKAQNLFNNTKQRMLVDSQAFDRYKKSVYRSYEARVPENLVFEEITADLCEYAMSGSERMYQRLEGLFEPGVLEKLAEQARGVFDANKTDGRSSETGENQNPSDSNFSNNESTEITRNFVGNIRIPSQGEETVSLPALVANSTVPDLSKQAKKNRGAFARETGAAVDIDPDVQEIAARIAEQTGRNIQFVETLGNGIEGKYDAATGTLTIAADSLSPLKAILKHELTHSLEGTRAYTELSDFVMAEFVQKDAEANGMSVEEIIQAKMTQYAAVGETLTREGAVKELVADYCAAKLFADEKAIRQLSAEKPSVARRIWAWLRSVRTKLLGTKQEKLIAKAEALYRDALMGPYRSGEGAQYSIAYTTDNRPVVVVEENILDGLPRSEWVKKVKQTIAGKFSDGIPVSGRLVRVNLKTRNEYTKSKDSQKLEKRAPIIYQDKFKSANNLDEIVLASTNYVNEDLKHERRDNFKEFARGDVLIRVGEKNYKAKVIVGFTTGNQMVLYDVIDFTPTNIEVRIKKESTQFAAQPQNREQSSSNVLSDITVPQSTDTVNTSISSGDENSTQSAIGFWGGRYRRRGSDGSIWADDERKRPKAGLQHRTLASRSSRWYDRDQGRER